MVRIYCLVDPRNNKPFYIGATISKLSIRLSQHIREAKQYVKHPPFISNTIGGNKHRLIVEIVNNNHKLNINEVMFTEKCNADHYERFFYLMFKAQGFELLQHECYLNYQKTTNFWWKRPENQPVILYKQQCCKDLFGNL